MDTKKFLILKDRPLLGVSEQSQRGVAMVEFAIILPLLLVLTFGIIEFGLVLYNKQVITNASREGARAGIVAAESRISHDSIENKVTDYTNGNLIVFSNNKSPTVVTDLGIYDENIDMCLSYSEFTGTPSANFRDCLKVEVAIDYQFLVLPPLLSLLSSISEDFSGWSPLTLKASTLMRYE